MKRPNLLLVLLAFSLGNITASTGQAQDPLTPETAGIQLGAEQLHRLKVGVKVRARGPCRGIVATVPVPMDWPEQEVRIADEEFSPTIRDVTYRVLDEGVKQMVVTIPRLDANEQADALLTVEVRRKPILPPPNPEIFEIPSRPDRSIRLFLAESPFIESRNSRIRSLARTIIEDKTSAWEQVEAIYDYVRENVQYRESELKGAVQTLREGIGDCEAMTSLFIALCRANKIPARMVWVTDHSYPEFYLIDDQQQGHWLPCQVSGARAFGEMPETRVILQKGDRFRIPETKELRRYVAVHLKAAAVRGATPIVSEVMEFVAAD